MEQTTSTREKFLNSMGVKLGTIFLIIIILLIPQSYTRNLIFERQERQIEAENDVTTKWSLAQTISGPYLSVPYYTEKEIIYEDKKQVEKHYKTGYFFPDSLDIDSEIEGIPLHRGMFDIVVYKSKINIKGGFNALDFKSLNIDDEKVDWDKIRMHLGVRDLRGIGENPTIEMNGNTFKTEPYFDKENNISGLAVNFSAENASELHNFKCNLTLKGSKELFFIPIGQTNTIKIHGDWKDPSFQGSYLPDMREISEAGFSGSWKILHFNRPYGQEFINRLPDWETSAFGLSLRMPVDQYQQSTRSSKYALLVISLSFLAMFLMEIITKIRIHFLQYTLVGAALVLYYTLLIALSEHTGFNLAYIIASLATVTLLGLYSLTFVTKKSNSLIFVSILSVFYSFVFIITKEQDYALLIGSIGLFVALAITMFVSRKIEWFKTL